MSTDKKKLRSHCPVNFALEHFGDKWTLLVLRDMIIHQKQFFGEFLNSHEKISTNILAARLAMLEKNGLIISKVDEIKRSKIKYSVTEMGLDLIPVLLEMASWSVKYDPETQAPMELIKQFRTHPQSVVDHFRKGLKKN